uniref:Uncharacterized protein n=1 Tax=Salmonella phage vB_SEnST11_KE24 TaxID=3161175 RepID=A0AAU8GIB3_9CAUD
MRVSSECSSILLADRDLVKAVMCEVRFLRR